LLAGDLRLLPLLWLIEVENEIAADDAIEPSPGLRSLSPALAALADFLCINGDLIEAAAGSAPPQTAEELVPSDLERFIRALPEDEKAGLLLRVLAGEPHVATDLRRRARVAT